MALAVKQLNNAGSSFLLTLEPVIPEALRSTLTPKPFTILLDPCLSDLADLPDQQPPDLVVISQHRSPHCHEPTLRRLLPPGGPKRTVILAEPAAARLIRSWKHFLGDDQHNNGAAAAADRLITLEPWEDPRHTGRHAAVRIPVPPVAAGGRKGEVTIAFIPQQQQQRQQQQKQGRRPRRSGGASGGVGVVGSSTNNHNNGNAIPQHANLHGAIGITYRPPSTQNIALSAMQQKLLTPPPTPGDSQRHHQHAQPGSSAAAVDRSWPPPPSPPISPRSLRSARSASSLQQAQTATSPSSPTSPTRPVGFPRVISAMAAPGSLPAASAADTRPSSSHQRNQIPQGSGGGLLSPSASSFRSLAYNASSLPRPFPADVASPDAVRNAWRPISLIFAPRGVLSFADVAPYATSHLVAETALPLTALLHCMDRHEDGSHGHDDHDRLSDGRSAGPSTAANSIMSSASSIISAAASKSSRTRSVKVMAADAGGGASPGAEIAARLAARVWISAGDGDGSSSGGGDSSGESGGGVNGTSSNKSPRRWGREEIRGVLHGKGGIMIGGGRHRGGGGGKFKQQQQQQQHAGEGSQAPQPLPLQVQAQHPQAALPAAALGGLPLSSAASVAASVAPSESSASTSTHRFGGGSSGETETLRLASGEEVMVCGSDGVLWGSGPPPPPLPPPRATVAAAAAGDRSQNPTREDVNAEPMLPAPPPLNLVAAAESRDQSHHLVPATVERLPYGDVGVDPGDADDLDDSAPAPILGLAPLPDLLAPPPPGKIVRARASFATFAARLRG